MAEAAEHTGANGHAGVTDRGGIRGASGVADGATAGQARTAAGSARAAARPTRGARVTRVILWLVAGVLAVRQAADVLRLPPGDRFAGLGSWTGPDGVLHVTGGLYEGAGARFTGTPFAGLVLGPLAGSARQALAVAWTLGTLLLVAGVAVIAARALPGAGTGAGTGAGAGSGQRPGRAAGVATPAAISLMLVSLPVRDTFSLGEAGIVPVLLVLVGVVTCAPVATSETMSEGRAGAGAGPGAGAGAGAGAGVLVGVGAALQPALLLFAVLLWATGCRAAARATGAAFAGCSLLAWAAMPGDSWTYWIHHLAGAGLGGPPDGTANQSLHGALLRLGLTGPAEIALYLLLAVAVGRLALRRAVRYARDGQLLLAVAVTGCAAVAVSPTGWRHQLLWVLLALAGKAGVRAADRPVWPVTVLLVTTLSSDVLLPNLAALAPVRDNVLLLAALAAACVVPFLARGSGGDGGSGVTGVGAVAVSVPVARAASASGSVTGALPGRARWSRIPLLPFWRRVASRPNLLLELLLIRVGYSLYAHIRAAAPAGRADAERHAGSVLSAERVVGIDIEYAVNRAVAGVRWLEGFCNFYYTSFHFVVPLAVLGVLYWRRPADYRWARAALGLATVLALAGFWLFPLAPPRLMPGLGFVDTVHGVQDLAHPQYGPMTAISNQYAAMPSLHFGWSLWCGVVVGVLAPRLWQKVVGAVHPVVTGCVIVATANHWVLDAVGGAVVVGAGFGLVRVLSGPRTAEPGEARQPRTTFSRAGG